MKVLPNLSGVGWIKDSKSILTTLFANAIVADYNQSVLYLGKITSISYIVTGYATDVPNMCIALQEVLTAYYSKFFNNLTVDVTHALQTTGLYNLMLNISVIDDNGDILSLSSIGELDNGILKNVIFKVNQ